ncbi:MAG: phenylalanine--tRNA ligase subunit beta, partial [Mucispirillum sp.]|nr:phenylalanine--tRNA ligase subunit beta [Mucispirillum sp.]
MNISINWLNQYIDLKDLSDKDIMNALTMAGLEAEGWNRIEKVENVVTAKVISKEKHPNADKLNVCKVSDGENEYTVVCGAPNVAEGQIVPFAKIGAVLGDIKIKEAKLRGTASFGMICSERELGLTNDHSGIMTLPENTPLGADINEILGMGDTVAEFNATPNRPDWLSVIGVARETAAVFKRKLTLPKIDLRESDTPASEYINVRVDDTKKCPIYIA